MEPDYVFVDHDAPQHAAASLQPQQGTVQPSELPALASAPPQPTETAAVMDAAPDSFPASDAADLSAPAAAATAPAEAELPGDVQDVGGVQDGLAVQVVQASQGVPSVQGVQDVQPTDAAQPVPPPTAETAGAADVCADATLIDQRHAAADVATDAATIAAALAAADALPPPPASPAAPARLSSSGRGLLPLNDSGEEWNAPRMHCVGGVCSLVPPPLLACAPSRPELPAQSVEADIAWIRHEVEALLLWQRPEHSAAALGSATIAFLALRMSGLTAPTLAALLLLARMAANVCAKLRPSGCAACRVYEISAAADSVAMRAGRVAARGATTVARLYMRACQYSDSKLTAQVAGALASLAVLGAMFDVLTLCYLGLVSALTVPALCRAAREQVLAARRRAKQH